MYTKSINQRIKRSNHAHLLTESLIQQGMSLGWLQMYGGRGLGCELLPNEKRQTSQAFGDLLLDMIAHRSAK